MPRETINAKADRLVVQQVPAARVFLVQGDHAAYAVTVVHGTAHCTCPATLTCSHATAALRKADELAEHLRAALYAPAPVDECDCCGDLLVDGKCPHRGEVDPCALDGILEVAA